MLLFVELLLSDACIDKFFALIDDDSGSLLYASSSHEDSDASILDINSLLFVCDAVPISGIFDLPRIACAPLPFLFFPAMLCLVILFFYRVR